MTDSKEAQVFPGPMNEGMSLRDYFAAKAMQGLIAADDTIFHHAAAEQGYLHADAMLAARSATPPQDTELVEALEDAVSALAEYKGLVWQTAPELVDEDRGAGGTGIHIDVIAERALSRGEAALSRAKEGR